MILLLQDMIMNKKEAINVIHPITKLLHTKYHHINKLLHSSKYKHMNPLHKCIIHHNNINLNLFHMIHVIMNRIEAHLLILEEEYPKNQRIME